MARSVQTVKLVSFLVLDGASSAIARRGFAAAAAQGGAASSSARAGLKRAGEEKVKSAEKVSWGPDPKTGYYRPESAVVEIDAAELRAVLLKHSH